MQHKKNNDVLFKVLANLAPVSLVIIMMMIIAAVYHTSQKAIAQVTVPYPYNLYPYTSSYPYPSTADVYPYSIYPYSIYPYTGYPYPTPYTTYPYPYPTPYTAYPYPYP